MTLADGKTGLVACIFGKITLMISTGSTDTKVNMEVKASFIYTAVIPCQVQKR